MGLIVGWRNVLASSAPTLGIHRQPWRVSVPPQPCCPDPTGPREPCWGGTSLSKTGARAALFRFLGSRYRLILASAPTPLRTGGPLLLLWHVKIKNYLFRKCKFYDESELEFNAGYSYNRFNANPVSVTFFVRHHLELHHFHCHRRRRKPEMNPNI